jgi:hypothetical protein
VESKIQEAAMMSRQATELMELYGGSDDSLRMAECLMLKASAFLSSVLSAKQLLMKRQVRDLGVSRGIMAETIRRRDEDGAFERAKFAKIVADTLRIIHADELQVYGVKAAEDESSEVDAQDEGSLSGCKS